MFSRVRTRIGAVCAALALVVMLATPAHAAGKTVHITKSDSAGNAVQGATFTLYVDAAPVGGGPPKGVEDTTVQGTCTTGANGQCDITDVPPGNYWVSETGPPTGYVAAADSTLEVKRGKKKVFEVVVVDDKKPSNTSVNDPTGDELAQDGTHIFQFGPSVAVSPNGKQVGVAFNDSAGFFSDVSAIGWAFSNDRGRSWDDLGQVPSSDTAFALAQPSVVFDPSAGAFVVASQGAIPVDQDLRRPVLVSRYDPQSGTWTPLVDTFPELAVGSSAHDPWLAVDSSPSSPYEGRIYLGFTVSNGDGQAQGFLSRSGNGGRTWSDPVAVTDLGTNDFLNPAVASDGRVYATWADFTAAAAATNDIYVSRSTDGGRTFSRPFPVATDVQKGGAPTSCGGSTQYAYLGGIGSGSPPRLAIDPADPGRIFIAFAGATGADTGDVFVSESRDHGETWWPVVPLGDPAGIQMFPDIEVTPDGRIGVSYYQASSPSQIDFVTSFLDGFGPTLSGSLHATVPVTDDPFSLWDMNPSFDSLYGDCVGLQGNRMAAPGSGFYVAWTDGGDPGPAGNGGVDPNIEFARLDPALATATTLTVSSTGSTVHAGGVVAPDPFLHAKVTVTLFVDDGPGGFEMADRVHPVLGAGGTYGVVFTEPGATCRLVVQFAGSDGRLPSSAAETFAC